MSPSLADFLNARLTETEQLAKAAAGDTDGKWTRLCWHADDPDEDIPPLAEDACCVIEGDDFRIYDEGGHDAEQAEHIVRHDPAAVLADCAFKRALLENAESALGWVDDNGDALPIVDDDAREQHETTAYIWLHDILRPMAQPFAEHPDFDPAWRP